MSVLTTNSKLFQGEKEGTVQAVSFAAYLIRISSKASGFARPRSFAA